MGHEDKIILNKPACAIMGVLMAIAARDDTDNRANHCAVQAFTLS